MNYVYAGYGVAIGGIGLYALWVIRRGRVLRRGLNGQDGGPGLSRQDST